MRYFIYTFTDPRSPGYAKPVSLHRFDDKGGHIICDKWINGHWADDPSLINVFGFGGGGDYQEVSESQANHYMYSGIMKSKEYLAPGEQAPKGAAVQSGKEGGKFYDTAQVSHNVQPDIVDYNQNLKAAMQQYLDIIPENTKLKYNGAYDLVTKLGRFFTPAPRPKGIAKEKDKECYRNAALLAIANPEYTYCEGMAMISSVPGLPFSHAWCVDKNGKVIDNTWPEHGTAYFGIPFNTDYLLKVLEKNKIYGVIPDYHRKDYDPFADGFPDDAIKKDEPEMVTIPMFTNRKGETVGDQQVPRFMYHMPRVDSKNGVKAYNIREKEAADQFGPGYENGKYVWLSTEPLDTHGTVMIDLTKLDTNNMRSTGNGNYIHRGDIPEEAVNRNVKVITRPEGARDGHTAYKIEKSREYLAAGEHAPKGVSEQTSKLGKRFYDTSAGYSDPNKKTVERPEVLLTPSGVRVPPNWQEVWVTTKKNSPLQARGRDAAGRPVYLHAVTFDNKNADTKWKRVAVFQKLFDTKIKPKVDKDANTSEEALVLYTIMHTGFRVGSSEEHIAKVKAYGTCTLEKSHVQVDGDKIHFHFPAKKGTTVDKTIKDKFLADKLRNRLEDVDTKGIFRTDSNKVLNYLRTIPNCNKFKNHDFRTYFANESAMKAMVSMAPPSTFQEFKKQRKKVSEIVGKELGDTAAVALRSYISPEVWDSWMQESWAGLLKKSEDSNPMEEFVNSIYYNNLDKVEMDDEHPDEKDDEYDGDPEYSDDDLKYMEE
jgi:DNA topoisomerase-1